MNFKKIGIQLIIACIGLFEIAVVLLLMFDISDFYRLSADTKHILESIVLIIALLSVLLIISAVIRIFSQKR